jgi:uncharacterized protein
MGINEVTFLLLVGLISGLLSGFFGIGGAVIVIPALIFMFGMSQHEAQGTSIAFLLAPVGILAAINYHKAGFINYKYAALLAVAFVVGAFFGSKFAINIQGESLKKIYAVFIILIGIRLFFK